MKTAISDCNILHEKTLFGYKSLAKDDVTLKEALNIFKPELLSLYNMADKKEVKIAEMPKWMEKVESSRSEMQIAVSQYKLAGCKTFDVEKEDDYVETLLE